MTTESPVPLSAEWLSTLNEKVKEGCLSYGRISPFDNQNDISFDLNPRRDEGRGTLRLLATITSLQDENAKLRAPVDMLLFCPRCSAQHVDVPSGTWANPPHKSHLCHPCRAVWRPSDRETNGVETIATVGKADTVSCKPTPPKETHVEAALIRMIDPEIQIVGNAIVSTDFRVDENCSDNLAIVLVSAYEDERDCPDEPNDDDLGWKPWALEHEKDLRKRMAVAAIEALDKHRARALLASRGRAPAAESTGDVGTVSKDLIEDAKSAREFSTEPFREWKEEYGPRVAASITSLQDENAKLRAPKDGPGGVVEQAAKTRPMALQAPSARMNAQDSAGAPPTEPRKSAYIDKLANDVMVNYLNASVRGLVHPPLEYEKAYRMACALTTPASRDRAPAAVMTPEEVFSATGIEWRFPPAFGSRGETTCTLCGQPWPLPGPHICVPEHRTPPPPAPPDDLRRQIVLAIMELLETKEVLIEPRPSIDELEKILNSEDPMRLTIKPDGSVVELVPAKTTVGAVADKVIHLLTTTAEDAVRGERERLIKFAGKFKLQFADPEYATDSAEFKAYKEGIKFAIDNTVRAIRTEGV